MVRIPIVSYLIFKNSIFSLMFCPRFVGLFMTKFKIFFLNSGLDAKNDVDRPPAAERALLSYYSENKSHSTFVIVIKLKLNYVGSELSIC